MPTRLIELQDGILIEAEVPEEEARPISTNVIKGVSSTFDQIKPILLSVSRPIASAWAELNQEMEIEQAEVDIGFSFEGEGNLYITKATANANLNVKLVLRPKKVE